MTNFWNSVRQKHFWNLIAVSLLNLHVKKHIRLWKTAVTLPGCVQIYRMIHQTKLTDILNPNKFKNCELKPWAGPTKSVLSIPFYGTPCRTRCTSDTNDMLQLQSTSAGRPVQPTNVKLLCRILRPSHLLTDIIRMSLTTDDTWVIC